MQKLKVLSAAEQVANYLREGVAAGVWRGKMPGVVALAEELGVNHKTVEAALSMLEREKVLIGQGARRPRRISRLAGAAQTRELRIGLLLHDVTDSRSEVTVELRHLLLEAGHAPFVAKRLLTDIGTDVAGLARLVGREPADAWLALAARREVLEWFIAKRSPVFALYGRFRSLPVAGAAPDKTEAYAEAVRTLAGLGHRRIVLLAREQHRQPVPSQSVRAFLGALSGAGIAASDYHYPLWENTLEGFHHCLESIFRISPPTALVVQVRCGAAIPRSTGHPRAAPCLAGVHRPGSLLCLADSHGGPHAVGQWSLGAACREMGGADRGGQGRPAEVVDQGRVRDWGNDRSGGGALQGEGMVVMGYPFAWVA